MAKINESSLDLPMLGLEARNLEMIVKDFSKAVAEGDETKILSILRGLRRHVTGAFASVYLNMAPVVSSSLVPVDEETLEEHEAHYNGRA